MAVSPDIQAEGDSAGNATVMQGFRRLAPVWLTVSPGWRLLIDSVVSGGFNVSSYGDARSHWIRTSVTLLGDVTVATGSHVSDKLLDRHNQAVAVATDRLARVEALLTGIRRGRAWLTHGLSLTAGGTLPSTGAAERVATGFAPEWLAAVSAALPAGGVESLLFAGSAAAGYGGIWCGRWAFRTGLRRWIRRRIQRAMAGALTPPPS